MKLTGLRALGAIVVVLAVASPPATRAQPKPKPKPKKDDSYTVITGTGQSLYRIAVPPLLSGRATRRQAKLLAAVLSNDLKLVGLFKVLNPKGFLANLKREKLGIKPRDWTNIGAQAVVKARARRVGRKVRVQWLLYDLSKGATPVLRKTYSDRRLRRIAHRFGDDIVRREDE